MTISSVRLKELLAKYGPVGLTWRIMTKPFRIVTEVWRKKLQNYHYIFRYDPDATSVPVLHGFTIQNFKQIEEIPDSLLEKLNNTFSKTDVQNNLIGVKHRGCILCVGFLNNEVVSTWLIRRASNIPFWFIDLNPDDVVFIRGVTAPAHRGKGLASSMHQAMASLFLMDGINIYIDVSIHNAPSLRSVEKSGFILLCKKKAIYEQWPVEL